MRALVMPRYSTAKLRTAASGVANVVGPNGQTCGSTAAGTVVEVDVVVVVEVVVVVVVESDAAGTTSTDCLS